MVFHTPLSRIVVAHLSVPNFRRSVVHITSAPYHPSTNGLAERAVQSFKQGLKKLKVGTLQPRLSQYLFHYRITPHTTTGLSPAEMLMGCQPRSLLDLLHPDSAKRMQSRQTPPTETPRSFEVMTRFSLETSVLGKSSGCRVRSSRSPGPCHIM